MKKSLILGAGFSFDFGMPLATELTEIFLGLFEKRSAKRFAKTLSQKEPYGEDRPINKKAIFEGVELVLDYKRNNGGNYEELLSNIEELGNMPGKQQTDKDSCHFLFAVFYDIIHTILTRYQYESYKILYGKNYQLFYNINSLMSDSETWVFSLNHDLYLECLAIDFGIPITYGDTKNISFPLNNLEMNNELKFTYTDRGELDKSNSGYFSKQEGINLVKLHGGLSELEYKDSTIICNQSLKRQKSSELIGDFSKIDDMAYYHQGKRIPGGRDMVITNSQGELDIIRKSMLTGGHKYSKTSKIKKGEEKLRILDDTLKDTDELTIIGYGFGDLHINFRVSNAMVLNSKLNIRIVDSVHKPIPAFLQQFDYDSRILGATCSAAAWTEYLPTEKWNYEHGKKLEANRKYRSEVQEAVETFFHSPHHIPSQR